MGGGEDRELSGGEVKADALVDDGAGEIELKPTRFDKLPPCEPDIGFGAANCVGVDVGIFIEGGCMLGIDGFGAFAEVSSGVAD